MKRTTELRLISSKGKASVLVPTETGFLRIKNHGNVMIICNADKGLFKRELPVLLTEAVNVILKDSIINLKKGSQGFLKRGRVYFYVNDEYIGLVKEYLQGKIHTIPC